MFQRHLLHLPAVGKTLAPLAVVSAGRHYVYLPEKPGRRSAKALAALFEIPMVVAYPYSTLPFPLN